MGGANSVAENFACDEYSSFLNKRLNHGCALFMEDHYAREAFVKYLKSLDWMESFMLERGPCNPSFVLESTDEPPDNKYLYGGDDDDGGPEDEDPVENFAQQIFFDYDMSEGMSKGEIGGYFSLDGASVKSKEEELDDAIDCCFSSEQMRAVLFASVFPLFLESKAYQDWVDSQTKDEKDYSTTAAVATAVTTAAISLTDAITGIATSVGIVAPPLPTDKSAKSAAATDEVDGRAVGGDTDSKESRDGQDSKDSKGERLDDLFPAIARRTKDIISQAISSVDQRELQSMLLGGAWLKSLMCTVEDLPLCVSLATARPERPGFPLVYVNKRFETTTGYSREEIVGKNCKFLQSDKSEPSQIKKLSRSLKSAKPVKVAITNVRKDGTLFTNLLAMKPIFDANGVYSYVIGVQYDLSRNSLKQIKQHTQQVNDLLSILPNVLK